MCAPNCTGVKVRSGQGEGGRDGAVKVGVKVRGGQGEGVKMRRGSRLGAVKVRGFW